MKKTTSKVHRYQTMRQRHGRGIRIGDIVVLNSGGPFMLVIGKSFGNVNCAWPDTTNAIQYHSFPEVCVY